MLKGLVRCSACGATLACNGPTSGKDGPRSLQCCNYSRGSCHTSHSITIPKIEQAVKKALDTAITTKRFEVAIPEKKASDTTTVDYDKLIALEERRLERAKAAYLAEVDSIEQYAQNKKEISARIEGLKAQRNKVNTRSFDINAFAKKAAMIAKFIDRTDVSESAKNEQLRTIIDKIIFEKAKGNVAVYFHD